MTSKTSQMILANIYLILIFVNSTLQCGPGRSYGTRRARKMTPLVFKQHVPNVSENTLGASGPSEGRITRQDNRFKDLVVNSNPNIVFRDEEGTGVGRIMSQRCRDKLDALAILVQNHWPGVRLRVIEVWDENDRNPQESLHYEGRAVDITTSDRDRTKYGMLARLAVNAGFDWVYYESRGHIHCSVRSGGITDSSLAIQGAGCFPRHSTVSLENGAIVQMSQLIVGDRVLAMSSGGKFQYEMVIAFLHRNPNATALVYAIETEDGHQLTVTPDHLVYASSALQTTQDVQNIRPSFVGLLRNDSFVYVRQDDDTGALRAVKSRVSMVTVKESVGLFAPLTSSGTIVVDDVVASCYASVDSHVIAHMAVAPLRLKHYVTEFLRYVFMTNVATTTMAPEPENGVHWYAETMFAFGWNIIPSYLWYASDSSIAIYDQ